jgi:hypothetical protein
MNFRVADTGVHPVLGSWLERVYGESCEDTTLLMVLAIPRIGAPEFESLTEQYMGLKSLIRSIGMFRTSRQVPSFEEFVDLLVEYWADDEVRAAHFREGRLVMEEVAARITVAIAFGLNPVIAHIDARAAA